MSRSKKKGPYIDAKVAAKVEKGADGKLAIQTAAKIFEDRGDAYSAACKL